MKKLPGIFNDVIGPVMRGPSSSHTAASWRLAKIGLEILNEPLQKAVIQFDKDGAWAPNFREQGTVMGIDGGLLGLEITDNRMKETEKLARAMGIDIHYEIASFPTNHANTVRLFLTGKNGKTVKILAISSGGGAFEIREIDEFSVQIRGDYYSLLVRTNEPEILRHVFGGIPPDRIFLTKPTQSGESLIQVNAPAPFKQTLLDQLDTHPAADELMGIHPVLPIVSGNGSEPPFTSYAGLLEYDKNKRLNAGQLGLLYERHLSGLTDQQLRLKMKELIALIDNSIASGLAGTNYKDRILQQQSQHIQHAVEDGSIPNNSLINGIIANVSAIMESKSAMEVIVANPTAGSCGTVGGLIKAVADELKASNDEVIDAYFAAGLIGVFFAQGPGFSAEEHGCQVECGAAAGMAAAGIVQLYGGSAKQAVDAASMAIQNMIGLICDPVADRVEVPCLGKNISAAVNALTSATMACAGFDAVIPLDEVIQTVSRVSNQMPSCVKCTGKGGLAVTKTAIGLRTRFATL